jgi:UDP-3-O-[3-hydroxymyristoyl] glucosamine N-acyltransferase
VPTIRDIVTHLVEACAVGTLPHLSDGQASVAITGLSQDTTASQGQMSWVSQRFVTVPGRLESFQGSLLLCPEGSVQSRAAAAPAYIECPSPKFAFASVVARFFAELTRVDWPSAGAHPIAADVIMGERVRMSAGVVIGPRVAIGDDVSIGPNSVIANCRIGKNVVIGANCSIGLDGFGYEKDSTGTYLRFPHVGAVTIGDGVEIGSNTCIDRGSLGDTKISEGAKIDNLVHIAHNVTIGRNVIIIANSMIGGSTDILEGAWLAPGATLMNRITIGAHAVIGLGAVVLKSVEPHAVMAGNPAKLLRKSE